MDHFELMRGLIIFGAILLVLLAGSLFYDQYAGDDVCSTGYVYSSFYGFGARCVYSEDEYVRDTHPSYSPSRGGMRG